MTSNHVDEKLPVKAQFRVSDLNTQVCMGNRNTSVDYWLLLYFGFEAGRKKLN